MHKPGKFRTSIWPRNVQAVPDFHTGPEPSQEDINKELGVGTVSADLELDAMKDAADAEILAVHNGLGRYVPLIAAFCRSRLVVTYRPL